MCDSCKDLPFSQDSKCDKCGDRCVKCSARNATAFDNPPCSHCGKREMIFKGYDTVSKFCQWLISGQHLNSVVLAHNCKNFDTHFILNYCVESGIFPDIIYQGTKIVTMTIKEINLRFIDSINFLPFSLKKVAQSFDLQYTKGYFPHMSNTLDMIGYVGAMPPPEKYGIENMTTGAREEFFAWYKENEHKVFDFDAELLRYAKDDVNILRVATMRFRDMIKEITTVEGSLIPGIDVYSFNTIAGSAMQIIRLLTMYEEHDIELKDGSKVFGIFKRGEFLVNDIPLDQSLIKRTRFIKSPIPKIPARGYSKQYRDSEMAIIWLEWEAKLREREIRHSRNGGEVLLTGSRFLADGYYEEVGEDGSIRRVVLEYCGCFIHGHECLPDRKKVRDPHTGLTLLNVYNKTVARFQKIRQLGFHLEVMWECAFKNMLETSEELRLFAEQCKIPKPLDLRDCFQGGRCETLKVYDEVGEGERIRYLDVISLYPTSVLDPLPICHPQIISNHDEMDYSLKSYKLAIIKLLILPPKVLYIPVLGFKLRGKLKFALCHRCAEKELVLPCQCTDEQRSFLGTWTNLEINEAVASGYKIKKNFQIYAYNQTSGDTGSPSVFPEYVKMFMAVKTEASGWPTWVQTENDKDAYIESFYVKQGIRLNKSKIMPNPPLRLIAKLFVNSVWGKFVQRLDLPKTVYVKTREQLAILKNDTSKQILDFHLIGENFIAVEFKVEQDFLEDPMFQNIVYGIFTTSIARIRLLKLLQKTDRRTIYTDTDSVIYKERMDEEILKVGDLMGDLSDELPENHFITQFASTGPKSYSYKVSNHTVCTKVKGFTLSHQASQDINFESIKSIVFGEREFIKPAPSNQISRVKHAGIVYNKPQCKILRKVFNKRCLGQQSLDTLPYGF